MADNTQPLSVMARLLDLSERRIQQLSREGVIPKSERGRYDLIGSVRGYIRYLRDLAMKADKGIPDYGAERARLVKARADLTEMEATLKRGELIPVEQTQEAWIKVVSHLRARLLVLPDKLAPIVYESESISEAKSAIKQAVWEALEELAETEIQIDPAEWASAAEDPDPDGAADTDAATEFDHQPVGGSQQAIEL